jgi:predicted GNAT family acetyltransferase
MPDRTSDEVIDNPAQHRFELPLEGEDIAAAYYRRDENGYLVLTHTEVPSAYGGRGFASTLAQGVFAIARARGEKLVLKCPFMAAWFAKHPDYADVVAG